METWSSQEPVLIYDRIDANRRNTIILLVIFTLLWLPFAIYVTHYVMGLLGVFILPALIGWDQIYENPAFVSSLAGIWALFISFFVIYLVYLHSSRLFLRIANARPLSPEEGHQLRRIVENLCIGSGLPQPRLLVIDSMAINAFSTGLGPHSASLVVTNGLLDALDRRELEGVIAHELSKIGNYDIRLNTTLAALLATMLLPLWIIKRIFQLAFRRRSAGCLVGGFFLWFCLPLIAGMIIIFIVLVDLLFEDPALAVLLWATILFPLVSPFISLFIYRTVSREREFLADADAALLTRYPAGLAQALAKMGAAKNARMEINSATAKLYIVNPLSGSNHFWDRLLSSHPPIEERIARLVRMGGITPSTIQKAHEAGVKYHQSVMESLNPMTTI